MTELELRRHFVETLAGYVGAKEGDERHRELIDLYNSLPVLPRGYQMTYTADWCVATAVAIGVKLGLEDIILPECSCTRQIAQYRALGRFMGDRNYVPQIADFIIYDWQDNGDPDHWGTVERVEGDRLTVIEGNMADKVDRRYLNIGDSRIYGYCLPDYASAASAAVRFEDVAEDAWYADAVSYCARQGLMLGTSESTFEPERSVTRAELAVVLQRLSQTQK